MKSSFGTAPSKSITTLYFFYIFSVHAAIQ